MRILKASALFVTTAVLLTVTATQEAAAACKVKQTAQGTTVAYMEESYPQKRSTRPYKIKGAMYQPLATADGYAEDGQASWYGRPFHGRKTANGETYNMFDYTAAHKTLPIPSCVRVTNLDNGKSIIVRINDRGPYKSDLGTDTSGRIIDLSLKSAISLGFRKQGVANVRVEALPVEEVH